MKKKNFLINLFNSPFFKHFIFWCVVFLYFSSTLWQQSKDLVLITQVVIFDIIIQIIIAYTIIYVLIPKLLNKNRKVLFLFLIILMIITSYISFSAYMSFYIKHKTKDLDYINFINRITNVYNYLGSFVALLVPTTILLFFNYYKKQKEAANLLEQKKTNELNTLKNQLNPHFLFNTLNNLYTLALKKSDRTPEVIAKLSEILDYILYRCKDNFVLLKNEITLLHNYIALEKIRYGKRVEINFNGKIESDIKIAPLLLLTFLENSFKHGVSQEINTATIDIDIKVNSKRIDFYLKNSKPSTSIKVNRESIGLQNIKMQLDLLYPNKYTLDITNSTNTYIVDLKIVLSEL